MNLKKELTSLLNQPIKNATDSQLYEAVVSLVKNRNAEIPAVTGDKKLYYISAEFLIGRQLGKNLINLGLYDEMKQMLAEEGKDLSSIEQMESEPSLGNGGLGRLAACFLDSMATLELPSYGYGIRYDYGIFKQIIQNGYQVEEPDNWLSRGNPWEIRRPEL